MSHGPKDTSTTDDLWIDFIEDELDPSLRQDMQRLLARAEKEKDICTRYETLREALENTIDARAERKFVESFDFESLHEKIMAQIPSEIDMAKRRKSSKARRPPARSANSRLRRLSAKARNVVIPALMGGLLVLSFALHSMFHPSAFEAREMDFTQHLVASTRLAPVVEGRSMLGEDLATAAASAKLERMSDSEARALVKTL